MHHPTQQSSLRLTLDQHHHMTYSHVNLQRTLQADVDLQQTSDISRLLAEAVKPQQRLHVNVQPSSLLP